MADTRISLGGKVGENYPLFWDESDKIVVNGILSDGVQIDKDNKSKAVFTVNSEIEYPFSITYPYAESTSAETAVVEFPAEQSYAEGSFAAGYFPMCGYAEKSGGTVTLTIPMKIWGGDRANFTGYSLFFG